MLIVDRDVLDIHRLPHQRSGLRILLRGGEEVRSHARAQVLRLSDIDHLALGVLVEVAAGPGRNGANLLLEVHLSLV